MKKGAILILTIIVAFIPISCEDSSLFIDCNKCHDPLSITDKYNIEIKVTLDNENRYVPVTIYLGDINNGNIIYSDTAYSNPFYSEKLEFGNYYSAVARYSQKGKTIFAVDGRMLKKEYQESSCKNPCYTIDGETLDLKLR